MTIFNITGGGSGGDGSLTFKEMTTGLYEVKASDWGNYYSSTRISQFYKDTLLESMEIPSGMTVISVNSFSGCTALTNIVIPSSVMTLDDSAFQNCSALTEVTIPSSVTIIGISTFRSCTAMTLVTINNPSSLSIKNYAFRDLATNVTGGCTITLTGSIPPAITANTFQGANIAKIIVPQGSLTTYQTATNWSVYANKMEEAQ